jgi:hypothetical protein
MGKVYHCKKADRCDRLPNHGPDTASSSPSRHGISP